MSPAVNQKSTYAVKNIDHLGLVAGMCQELKLAHYIDQLMPKKELHNITHGQCLVAMILNGLGFSGRTLHMVPEYFQNKPTERLIGPGVMPEHINDDALGRFLDTLFEADVSLIYQAISQLVVEQLGLSGKAVHIDITSFHVDGSYVFDDDEDTKRVQLVKGYSRDHRPELNQIILELITENQAGIPVYMQALSGNTNDQSAFGDVVKYHLHSLKSAQDSRYLIGDSALYVAETLQAMSKQKQLFISRVPMKIKEAKQLVRSNSITNLTKIESGYSGLWVDSEYAGVKQKWLLVRSEQAVKRESTTLEKNIAKSLATSKNQFDKLCRQEFACEADALAALKKFEKIQRYANIQGQSTIAVAQYECKGRPKKGQEPTGYYYNLSGELTKDQQAIETARQQSGHFILATNDTNETLTMDELLSLYKSQQSVERGFRFLKSPEFLTSSIFLKKPERIEALLMVMTCSLMVYAALEHRIRTGLKENDLFFPDMKKKPTQKPTAKWVFFCFAGIYEHRVGEATPVVINVIERQKTILEALGPLYWKIYS